MSDTLTVVLLVVLLVFPPALLGARFFARRPAWGWLGLLVVLFVLSGWALVVLAYVEEQRHIAELIDQGRHDELPPGWDSDGASGLFAVFAGWLIPLVYFLFWLALYSLATLIRGMFSAAAPGAGGQSSRTSKRPSFSRRIS